MSNQAQQAQQPQKEEVQLTFTFPVSAVNTIIAALDELPHKYSRVVIDSIQRQAQSQIQPKPTAEGPLADKVVG